MWWPRSILSSVMCASSPQLNTGSPKMTKAKVTSCFFLKGWWEKKLHKLHRNGSHCSSNSNVIGQISSMLNTFSRWLPKAWNQWSSQRKDFLWNIFPGFCLVFSWVFVFVFFESFCLVTFLCYGKDPVIIHYCSLLWTSRPFYVAECVFPVCSFFPIHTYQSSCSGLL